MCIDIACVAAPCICPPGARAKVDLLFRDRPLEYSDDENGRVVDGLEKAIDLKLTDPSYRNMLKYGLSSQAEINVPPGRYKLQAVVRESNQARMGSQSKLIEIP
jgi:hypothetical protein